MAAMVIVAGFEKNRSARSLINRLDVCPTVGILFDRDDSIIPLLSFACRLVRLRSHQWGDMTAHTPETRAHPLKPTRR